MKIDIDQIKVLLEMVSEADIAELTIQVEEEKITIKKSAAGMFISGSALPHHEMAFPAGKDAGHKHEHPAPAGKGPHPEDNSHGDKTDNLVAITAPMVGTFYRSSSPTADPFVEAGDKIAVGQTICIIEAMKLMNDLPAEIAGKVVKVCAENGATVEFGQQLFLVDPKA